MVGRTAPAWRKEWSTSKHEAHRRCRSTVPDRSVTSRTSLQKQVGHTSVQFPQERQRSATSSHRGWSRFDSSRAGSPSVSRARPMWSRAPSRTARRPAASSAAGAVGHLGQHLRPRGDPTRTRNRCRPAGQLGEGEVVAGARRRARSPWTCRSTSTPAPALDGHDEGPLRRAAYRSSTTGPPCRTRSSTPEGGQLAGPDPDHGDRRRSVVRLGDGHRRRRSRPATPPRREGRTPTSTRRGPRPTRTARGRRLLQAVVTGCLLVAPAPGEVPRRAHLVEDDRPVADHRAPCAEPPGLQGPAMRASSPCRRSITTASPGSITSA